MTTDLRTPITGTRMMADMAGFVPCRLYIRLMRAAAKHRRQYEAEEERQREARKQ